MESVANRPGIGGNGPEGRVSCSKRRIIRQDGLRVKRTFRRKKAPARSQLPRRDAGN